MALLPKYIKLTFRGFFTYFCMSVHWSFEGLYEFEHVKLVTEQVSCLVVRR